MTVEQIVELHQQGFNCAQIVFSHGAEILGTPNEDAWKISAAFGGGMGRGETCGCVTGALMALGLKWGQDRPFAPEKKAELTRRRQEFETLFLEEHDSLICKELLGCDPSTPEGRAEFAEKDLSKSFCEPLMLYACNLLDEFLAHEA